MVIVAEKFENPDSFIEYAKIKIKNVSSNPSQHFIDKVLEIFKRKQNHDFYTVFSNEFAAQPNKIEYWLERGYSQEEAEDKRLEKVLASSCSLQALVKKFGTVVGHQKFNEINEKKSNTLDGFLKRHGPAGKEKYEEYKKKMSAQNTLEGMLKKYGEEGKTRYEKMLQGKVHTLDAVIARHGEKEGKIRYENANKKRKLAQKKEGFIQRFGLEEGIKKYNQTLEDKRNRNTVEYFIAKHGETMGREKFAEWYTSTIGCTSSYSNSKVANRLFDSLPISTNTNYGDSELIIELDEIEQSILSKTFVRPDFVYENKIIEFYGDYWHCRESMFESDYFNPRVGKSAKEIWQYDKHRIDILKNRGYSVLVIWEGEFLEDEAGTITKCVNFLNTQ